MQVDLRSGCEQKKKEKEGKKEGEKKKETKENTNSLRAFPRGSVTPGPGETRGGAGGTFPARPLVSP